MQQASIGASSITSFFVILNLVCRRVFHLNEGKLFFSSTKLRYILFCQFYHRREFANRKSNYVYSLIHYFTSKYKVCSYSLEILQGEENISAYKTRHHQTSALRCIMHFYTQGTRMLLLVILQSRYLKTPLRKLRVPIEPKCPKLSLTFMFRSEKRLVQNCFSTMLDFYNLKN